MVVVFVVVVVVRKVVFSPMSNVNNEGSNPLRFRLQIPLMVSDVTR